jgi:hypothetical protein
MTPEEFFDGWEKAYIEKFGSPPSFGRGYMLDQAESMAEAIRTNTPIPALPTQDVVL